MERHPDQVAREKQRSRIFGGNPHVGIPLNDFTEIHGLQSAKIEPDEFIGTPGVVYPDLPPLEPKGLKPCKSFDAHGQYCDDCADKRGIEIDHSLTQAFFENGQPPASCGVILDPNSVSKIFVNYTHHETC
jgi:hypothetical protein